MTLRDDAIAIWQAGVDAVDSARLVQNNVAVNDTTLKVGTDSISLDELDHIEVVGAGKAGAGMARGLLAALASRPQRITVSGWLDVPADCVEPLDGIHLHAARPAGVNEPTPAGVAGTQEIIRRMSALGKRDLCIVLISGGGSALLTAPVPQISLDDKLAVTRTLAAAGATIQELNIVRSQLSLVKGGGLLLHAGETRVITLIISDVIGDPPDIIASGPTVSTQHNAATALQVLRRHDPQGDKIPATVYQFLNNGGRQAIPPCSVSNQIIGSNRVALNAAAASAKQLGYRVISLGCDNQGEASHLGRMFFTRLSQVRHESTDAVCVLAGGETTVQLVDADQPRKGGRNQEVVLAAIVAQPTLSAWNGIALLSGGTDGEDGPTNAAGAIADEELVQRMQQQELAPESYLAINNAYAFFEQVDGLLLTGPTHTNVMDVAVGLVRR
ncbi:MAG: DUF4147 domain-containing protein [Planctomycetaceae bacterium]